MNSGADDQLDQSDRNHVQLYEAGLLLLAALGIEEKFPDNVSGLETLVSGIAEGRPGRPMDFAIEVPGGPRRNDEGHLTWISPGPPGCLRLRRKSEAAVLRPDGRLNGFESTSDSQTPKPGATEEATADHDIAATASRFRTESILGVHSAAPTGGEGPFVSFVTLYRAGVVIYYSVPRPPERETAGVDPPTRAIELPLILSDSLGNGYEEIDLGVLDMTGTHLRASRSFVPAVPAEAAALFVRFGPEGTEIQIPLR